MILAAVIVGYLLGIAPFIAPKILGLINSKNVAEKEEKESTAQEEILNEWLNGPQEKSNVNQEDIWQEYMTGKVTKGE